ANAAMCRLAGCADLNGCNLLDFLFPEEREATWQRLLARTGDDHSRLAVSTESRLRRADGGTVYVMISSSCVPMASDGRLNVCVMVTDISERVQMAQELQRLNLDLGRRVEE